MNDGDGRSGIFLISFLFLISIVMPALFASIGKATTSDDVITIEIDNESFFRQLDQGTMIDAVSLYWSISHDGSSGVTVSIYIGQDGEGWVSLASNILVEGEILIDPIEMGIENGDGYCLRILAINDEGRYTEEFLSGKFSVDIERDLNITVRSLDENSYVKDRLEIEWEITGQYVEPLELDLKILHGYPGTIIDNVIMPMSTTHASIDTRNLEDYKEYWLIMTVKDNNGLTASSDQLHFTKCSVIQFEPGLTGIKEGDILWEPLKIRFIPHPNPDALTLCKTDIYFQRTDSDERVYIIRDTNSTKEFEWEPYRFDQGSYTMFQVSEGNGYKFRGVVNFTICDGTIPMIEDVICTSCNVDESIEVLYKVRLIGPSGHDMIRANLSYMDQEGDWVEIGTQIEYSEQIVGHTEYMSSGTYVFRICVYNGIAPSIFSEFYINDVEVHHNDPPFIGLKSSPAKGETIDKEVNLSWFAMDIDGSEVIVDLYYRYGDGEWVHIDTLNGSGHRSYVWNVSKMEGGPYDIRLVVKEITAEGLFSQQITPTFNITGKGERKDVRVDPDASFILSNYLPSTAIFILGIIFISSLVALIVIRNKRKVLKNREKERSSDLRSSNLLKKVLDRANEFRTALPAIGGSSVQNEGGDAERNISPKDGSIEELIDILGCRGDDDVGESDLNSYKVLGLSMNATNDQVKNAYLHYVKRYHPDKFAHISEDLRRKAELELERKNRAKEVLLDHQKRAILDMMLREGELKMIRDSSMNSRIRKLR